VFDERKVQGRTSASDDENELRDALLVARPRTETRLTTLLSCSNRRHCVDADDTTSPQTPLTVAYTCSRATWRDGCSDRADRRVKSIRPDVLICVDHEGAACRVP